MKQEVLFQVLFRFSSWKLRALRVSRRALHESNDQARMEWHDSEDIVNVKRLVGAASHRQHWMLRSQAN